MAPHTPPPRSSRPGEAVARLDLPTTPSVSSALVDERKADLREQGRPLSPEPRIVRRALDQLRHRRQGVVPEAGLGVDGGQLLPAGLAEPRRHLTRWVHTLDRAARKDVA